MSLKGPGAPKKEIPLETVSTACYFHATKKQIIGILRDQGYEISEKTLDRRILEAFNCNFDDYREQKKDQLRLKLIQKAVKMALDGNVAVLIFCLKNLCGWSDKPGEERGDGKVFELAYKVESAG